MSTNAGSVKAAPTHACFATLFRRLPQAHKVRFNCCQNTWLVLRERSSAMQCNPACHLQALHDVKLTHGPIRGAPIIQRLQAGRQAGKTPSLFITVHG